MKSFKKCPGKRREGLESGCCVWERGEVEAELLRVRCGLGCVGWWKTHWERDPSLSDGAISRVINKEEIGFIEGVVSPGLRVLMCRCW